MLTSDQDREPAAAEERQLSRKERREALREQRNRPMLPAPAQPRPRAEPMPMPMPEPLPEDGAPRGQRPDLLDAILQFLRRVHPELGAVADADMVAAIRREYGGRVHYVRTDSPSNARKSTEVEAAVRRLFNGRNVTEVARELKIGRTTVVRILRRPGLK